MMGIGFKGLVQFEVVVMKTFTSDVHEGDGTW